MENGDQTVKDLDHGATLGTRDSQLYDEEESVESPPSDPPPGVETSPGSQFIQDCLRYNEMGDGVLFCKQHRGSFVFNKSSGEWLAWSGHHWEIDAAGRAISAVEAVAQAYEEEALKVGQQITWVLKKGDANAEGYLREKQKALFKRASKLRTEKGRLHCLAFAHTNAVGPLYVLGDRIDQEPWLLPCANGVVDLRTGDMAPGQPGDFLMRASGAEYHGIETPAPLWEAFLRSILEDPEPDPDMSRPQGDLLVEYVQRVFGYAATGLTTEPVVPILVGQGRNGKSTLVETISHVMGNLAGPIPSEMLLDAGRFTNANAPTPDIMGLRGLRIAFASEVEEGRRFSASRVKWLSGSDSLVGRSPHDKHSTRFRPTHTLILLSNHEPGAPMSDPAFWERIHLIPFNFSFVDRPPKTDFERPADKELAIKLREEGPGILAWLVRGCLAWQRIGLRPPDKVKKATEAYRRSEDILADFLEQRCVEAPEFKEGASPLYDSFKTWWEDNVSKKPPSQRNFGKWMGRRFQRRKSGGIFAYHGIRLLGK